MKNFKKSVYPLFFGAGNVTELIDADSVGVNALLAGMAMEVGAAVIFTSEHSDKTTGSISEMRRATEMMALARDRPYPKDLGIDLLVLKEKRRRREPPLEYHTAIPAITMPDRIEYDPKGNFRIGIEGDQIVAVINGMAIRGQHWQDVLNTILTHKDVSLLDHAGYLGRELYKAAACDPVRAEFRAGRGVLRKRLVKNPDFSLIGEDSGRKIQALKKT